MVDTFLQTWRAAQLSEQQINPKQQQKQQICEESNMEVQRG